MTSVTDPARELAEVASRLNVQTNAVAETFLAEQFKVDPSSPEFFKILASILGRADLVAEVIKRSEMDKDHQQSALSELSGFKEAFAVSTLVQHWDQVGLRYMRDHGRAIQYLSPVVRRHACYPKLSDEEVAEFLALIDDYLSAIAESDEGPDFVRQAIIDGLTAFRMQLSQIGWLGSGYALAAFREVMFAYEAARAHFKSQTNPDADAFLKGLAKIIKSFKAKVDEAQSWTDTAASVWKFYQIGSAAATPLLLTGTVSLP